MRKDKLRLKMFDIKKLIIVLFNNFGGWVNFVINFIVNVSIMFVVVGVLQSYMRFITSSLLGFDSEWERIIQLVTAAIIILFMILKGFTEFEDKK